MSASLSPWPSLEREPQEVETSPNGRYIRYNILLGKGACKRVYKALDTEEGREVAWNQVELLGMERDEEARQHLQEEIRVLQQLKHKNIMTFYAWWYDKSNLQINFITELFTAGNLRQYRKKLKKNLSENVLKRWAHQILEGLLYMHGHTPPIVHRDLKCDNIFVNSATGEIKIGDLGLATVQQTAMSVVGTPEFMAPEVYDESYDERCDIYSFGMCILELATLEYPYAECHSVPQIFKKVTLGTPPASLVRVNPGLREFISLCIAHNPADRPSARELLKHPYLEAVRLAGCGDSGQLSFSGTLSIGMPLNGASSSGGLATMSPGAPGSGWNTPSGTLHCAASVRDLREALHQQEALARHHHQQQQQLQQQLQSGSCPDVHAAAEGEAATAAASGGLSHELLRSNTVTVAMLSRTLSIGPTTPVQLSPLGRKNTLDCVSPMAVTAVAVAPSPLSPSEVRELAGISATATPAAAASSLPLSGSAAAAAAAAGTVATASLRARLSVRSATSNDSDSDSDDEEVLVPIDEVKAGLLDVGFVEYTSEPAETSRDPVPLTLADSPTIASDLLRYACLHSPTLPTGKPYCSSRLQPRKAHRRKTSPPRAAGFRTCKAVTEEQEQAGPPGGQHDGKRLGIAAKSEKGQLGFSSGAGPSLTDVVRMDSKQTEDEDASDENTSVGLTPAPSIVDVDPWAQRLALRVCLEAVMGVQRSGGSFPAVASAMASADFSPSLACSHASSMSSTAMILARLSTGSGTGSAVSGGAGRHSRQESADAVTFSAQVASGACTPALLRRSSSGESAQLPQLPPIPPPQLPCLPASESVSGEGQGAGAATKAAHLQTESSLSRRFSNGPPAAVTGSVAMVQQRSLPLPMRARGTAPSPGASANSTAAPGMVRLPSFRNRVLLTTVQAPQGTGTAGGDGGNCTAAPCFRSTSARFTGGTGGLNSYQTRQVANYSCPALPIANGADGDGVGSLGDDVAYLRTSDAVAGIAAASAVSAVAGTQAVASRVKDATAAAAVEHFEEQLVSQADGLEAQEALRSLPPLEGVFMHVNKGAAVERSEISLPQPPLSSPPPAPHASPRGPSGSHSRGISTWSTSVELINTVQHCAASSVAQAAGQLDDDLAGKAEQAALELPSAFSGAVGSRAATGSNRIDGDGPVTGAAALQTSQLATLSPVHPTMQACETAVDVTVVKELSRPIQGVIMRLKQWKRLAKDRAKGRRG